MKGIIVNLLESVVRREYGDSFWDELLDAAHLDGAYTSLGSYPDEDLVKLVRAASSTLNLPMGAVIRWFGRKALPLLAKNYPHFFEGHRSARTFLLTLNDVIHSEVRKIYPGAEVPEFDYDTSLTDELLMGYRSPRKLCALAHGFIEGAAAHYGEELVFEQPKCMHNGDEKCVFKILLKKSEARSDDRGQ